MKHILLLLMVAFLAMSVSDCETEQPPVELVHNYVDGYQGVILGTGQQTTDTIEWYRLNSVTVNGVEFDEDTYLVLQDEPVEDAVDSLASRMTSNIQDATGEQHTATADVRNLTPNGFVSSSGMWFCVDFVDDSTEVAYSIVFETEVYVRGESSWADTSYTYTREINNDVDSCVSVYEPVISGVKLSRLVSVAHDTIGN